MLFFLLIFSNINAQEFQLTILEKDTSNSSHIDNLNYQKSHTNKESIYKEIDSFIKQLNSIGFLNAKPDTITSSDHAFTAYIELGSQIKNITLNYNGISKEIIQKATKQYAIELTKDQITIPFSEISNFLQSLADHFETNGKSFTTIRLRNILISNDIAFADLKIEQSENRSIDKIIIKGYDNFPKKFLRHELNIKKGTVFNKQILNDISTTINHLNFVNESKSPEVLFTNDSTYIYLYLEKKKANKFDGVLGFASKEKGSGLEFNGYLDFNFNNIFNNGENIFLLWKNNGNDSQKFHLGARIPYIFNLPITPEVNFKLFRQDTTYSNISTNAHISYPIYNKGEISANISSENSTNLLKDDYHNPGIQSFKNIFYGGTYRFKILENDLLFPIKFQMNLNAMIGNRNMENIKTSQSKFELFGNYTYAINPKNYLFIQNHSAILNSDNYVNNELFRIGGANSFRGVNEESIFASMYTIFNLEYRFRPTVNSFFYSITDYTFFENDLLKENSSIYSLGLGYAFITKIGLLNISYAVAKHKDLDFSFDNSKIHIKIISVF
jgi:hypothetical protein